MTDIFSFLWNLQLFLFINHVAESIQEIFCLICLIYLLFILLIFLFIYLFYIFIYLFIYLLKTEEIHLIIDGYISVIIRIKLQGRNAKKKDIY